MAEIAVLGQDPRFGGGAWAQTSAFLDTARALGHQPRLHYVRQPGLGGAAPEGRAVRPLVRGLDGVNQAAAAVPLAGRVRDAAHVWVVAAAASYGAAAPLARRPYACWIGTSLADEWRSRRPGLSPSRRAALALSAPLLQRLERRVLAGARAIYATSPWSRELLAQASGRRPDEIGILPIPVDTATFRPAPDAEWEAGLARPTLVFVGRSDDPRKNVGLLLDAFRRLRAVVPEARLRLVGSAPGVALPAGAETAGPVSSVADELRRATIFVLPSLQEGFGIVVAEALASGLPAVVTPCGGPEALVRDSRGGRVLSSFDPDELAETLARLLADRDTLRAMRAAGREHVAREHAPERLRELVADALARFDG